MSPLRGQRARAVRRAGSVKKLDEMIPSLKPLTALLPWRRKDAHADQLYGAIVARSRLPVFYQSFGVPDTLEGRFVVLSLHLFAVLHRLGVAPAQGQALAQALADRFSADMETVLREIGVGDMSVPKKVRGLAAAGAALLQDYEDAFGQEDVQAALTTAIARAWPGDEAQSEAASGRLASYLLAVVHQLDGEPLEDLYAGMLKPPGNLRAEGAGREP
jgi:cytochrome b pre-mRNA-processing protein 3